MADGELRTFRSTKFGNEIRERRYQPLLPVLNIPCGYPIPIRPNSIAQSRELIIEAMEVTD
jgi:hypothetical protein